MRKSISLRFYFTVVMGILMLVLTGILSILIGNRSTNEVKKEIGDSLAESAYQMADKMDTFMWGRSGEIYTLSSLETLKHPDKTGEVRNLLNELKEYFPSYAWIGLTDKKGVVVAATDSVLEGVDIHERPVFVNGSQGKFIGDVHEAVLLAKLLPNPLGEAIKFVDVSVAIKDSDGEFLGVLAAHLSWSWAREMKDKVLRPVQNADELEMFVISAIDDTVILGPENMLGTTVELEGLQIAREKEIHWQVETWEDGKEYLTGYAIEPGYLNYEGLGWTVIIRQPLSLAYKPVKELILYIWGIGIFSTLFFGIIIWICANRIARPIKAISKKAQQLSFGQMTEIPEFKGIKEIERLSITLREMIHNLTTSEAALDNMKVIANNDPLTGIPNRNGLGRFLDSIPKNITENDVCYMFFSMDLDGFKAVNDTYGHPVGDILLKGVAKRLNQLITKDGFAARLGGDEFVFIHRGGKATIIDEGKKTAEQIINVLSEPYDIQDNQINVGCSIGGAVWEASRDIQEILKLSDEALYISKRTGKNKFTYLSSNN